MERNDNELIAEFMGGKYYPNGVASEWIFPDGTKPSNLHYHDSWDWLMDVVDKIAEMENTEIRFSTPPNRCLISYYEVEDNAMTGRIYKHQEHVHVTDKTLIAVTHCAIVEFIKWRNSVISPYFKP